MDRASPVPRVGVGTIIRRGNELLLLCRRNVHGEGTWSTPGGHLDFGEEPSTCAIREASEETCLIVERVSFIGVTNDVFGADLHYVTLWFTADEFTGEAVISAAYEMSELDWFPVDQLPEPIFPPLRRVLTGECHGDGFR